jgi:hypothetical protein
VSDEVLNKIIRNQHEMLVNLNEQLKILTDTVKSQQEQIEQLTKLVMWHR